jgi:hypothetical protein
VSKARAPTTDAGTVDAGTVDAGTVDAGTVDAGTVDAGTVDAGTVDAGAPDSGVAADAGGPLGAVVFEAYNDLAPGADQQPGAATIYTTTVNNDGGVASGALRNFATGLDVGVTLTVLGGSYVFGPQATASTAAAPPGTDAFEIFDGRVDTLGSVSYHQPTQTPPPTSDLLLTFAGMNPARSYDVVFFGHRGAYGWDRAWTVGLEGADAFTNTSSAAVDNPGSVDGSLYSGPADATTRIPADNHQGYVARFVGVAPGADGEVTLRLTFDGTAGNEYGGKYANALLLRERLPP